MEAYPLVLTALTPKPINEYTQDECDKILKEAHRNANGAALHFARYHFNQRNAKPDPTLGELDHLGACGFAWVTVTPARGPLISLARKEIKASNAYEVRKFYGDKAYGGGWQWWAPGWSGQSIDIKEAGARAFCTTLKHYGFNAHVGSRLD